jgi:hypothetical protein
MRAPDIARLVSAVEVIPPCVVWRLRVPRAARAVKPTGV